MSAGGNITFTLNFKTPVPVDASIVFDTWTINGVPVPPGWYVVAPNTIIDIKYKEHVSGEEEGELVTVHQTAWLQIHNMGSEGEPGPSIWIHAVNADKAVSMDPRATKLYQMTTVGGVDAPYCTEIELKYCVPVMLDVEVDWELAVCTDYTKSINWLGFPSPPDILFDVLAPYNGLTFTLISHACVEVGEGYEDTNPDNDCTADSPPLTIMYWSGS